VTTKCQWHSQAGHSKHQEQLPRPSNKKICPDLHSGEINMCVCVCVCVWERERERERDMLKIWQVCCIFPFLYLQMFLNNWVHGSTKPFSYCRYEPSQRNLDRHKPPCQCTTQTYPLSSHTSLKSRHAVLLVQYTLLHVWLYRSGIVVLFTQFAIAMWDSSNLPTVKLFCQNQTSFAKKWIKYYIIKFLPMKHSQNQYKLSDSHNYMWWHKKCCCLKPAAATFCVGRQKQGL